MNVSFYWEERFPGDLVPRAKSDALSSDGLDFVSCLFADSGGGRFDDPVYLGLLDDGVCGIESVRKEDVKCFDWCLNYWGAEFEGNIAKIYSLCDEGFFITVNLNAFEKALIDWKNFILNGA